MEDMSSEPTMDQILANVAKCAHIFSINVKYTSGGMSYDDNWSINKEPSGPRKLAFDRFGGGQYGVQKLRIFVVYDEYVAMIDYTDEEVNRFECWTNPPEDGGPRKL